TEHGAIQAANVLNSPKAVEMGIYVVRAFLRLREMLASNTELARQFAQLEARLDKKLAHHDEAIAAILSAIRQLMNPPSRMRRPIGFTADLSDKKIASARRDVTREQSRAATPSSDRLVLNLKASLSPKLFKCTSEGP